MMTMKKKLMTAGAVTGVVVLVGTTTAFGFGGKGIHQTVEDIADDLGITVEELRDLVGEDKTIAQVAEEAGIDVNAAVAEALTEYQTSLDEAVAAGRITQEEADSRLAGIQTRVDEALNAIGGPVLSIRGHAGLCLGKGVNGIIGGMHVGQQIAESMGVTQQELRELVGEEGTIAQVAADAGVDAQSIVDGALAEAGTALDAAVADGTITQERADELLADMETRIDAQLNAVGGPAGKAAPHMRGHGRGHGGPGMGGRGHGFGRGKGGGRGFDVGPGYYFNGPAPETTTVPDAETTSL